MIEEPAKARLLRLAWRLSGRRRKVDRFLTGFLTHRNYLPEREPQDVIPRFLETEVKIKHCPIGPWSTPLIDVVVLLKAVLGFESKRILELGSFRGETARLLAENTPDDAMICAVDIDERHGEAYRGQEIERKIKRKTGRISRSLFDKGEKFDLIFVDADHDFASVMEHTELAFSALEQNGAILWHDYNNDSYFHGLCSVAEALNEFQQRYPVRAIKGTGLAIHSNIPGWDTRAAAAKKDLAGKPASAWEQKEVRG